MRFLRELCKIACPACPAKNVGMFIFIFLPTNNIEKTDYFIDNKIKIKKSNLGISLFFSTFLPFLPFFKSIPHERQNHTDL